MSKLLRAGFSVLTLALVFSVFTVLKTNAQGIKNEILKRMDEHNKMLKSVQANVKMDKYNSQLEEHDISEGTVKYLPGSEKSMYVRINWTKPVEEQLAVVNGEYVLYRPRLKQAIVGKVDKAQGNAKTNGALAFMSMSKAQLRNNYEIDYIGEEKVGGVSTWHLKLTPKTASQYKQADLWVDGNGMPIQATVKEKNNDSTTILLSSIEKNKSIPSNVFAISPPKGTKIING